MSDRYEDAYGDAIYETWRRRGNPDLVEYERVRDDVDEGHDRFESAEREARRITEVQGGRGR